MTEILGGKSDPEYFEYPFEFPAENVEAVSEKMRDFFELDEEQVSLLRQKIKKSNGLIRIFVHPYYSRPYYTLSKEEVLDGQKELIDIDKAIKILVSSNSENTPPILIMEEHDQVEKLAKSIAFPGYADNFTGKIVNDIYVVSTLKDDSVPVIDSDIKNFEDDSVKTENWNRFIGQLKSLGVKSIIIGGMHLALWDSPKGDISTEKCLGNATKFLRENFDVNLSNLTFDDNHGMPKYEERRKKLKKQLNKKL